MLENDINNTKTKNISEQEKRFCECLIHQSFWSEDRQFSQEPQKNQQQENIFRKLNVNHLFLKNLDSFSLPDSDKSNESNESDWVLSDFLNKFQDSEWCDNSDSFICLNPHMHNTKQYAELANRTLKRRVLFILRNRFEIGSDDGGGWQWQF